jgi:hypothetical protein
MNKHLLMSKLQEFATTLNKLDYQIYSDKEITSKNWHVIKVVFNSFM